MKFLDPKEALRIGVIQEVNRTFLHPLGLALGVRTDDITGISSYYIWDTRDDKEGIYFPDEVIRSDVAKQRAEAVMQLFEERADVREQALGYLVQPIPGVTDLDASE